MLVWVAGCGTPTFDEDLSPGQRAQSGATNKAAAVRTPRAPSNEFQIGDVVVINFAGMENPPPKHSEIIKEDGLVSPPLLNHSFKAVGKTPADLQQELYREYTNIFARPTITVEPAVRYYTVAGEVLKPGPQMLLNETGTDIVMAIAAAGGFNEFAKRSDIQVIRAGGRKVLHINYKKAIAGKPDHDIRIYPNDRIFVPRSAI